MGYAPTPLVDSKVDKSVEAVATVIVYGIPTLSKLRVAKDCLKNNQLYTKITKEAYPAIPALATNTNTCKLKLTAVGGIVSDPVVVLDPVVVENLNQVINNST